MSKSKFHFPADTVPEVKVVAHGDGYSSWKRVIPGCKEVPGFMQIAISRTDVGANSQITDPNHLHPDLWEVYFIHAGRARFWVGEEEFLVGPGDVVMVPPKTIHNHEVLEELRLFYLMVLDPRQP